jgi:glutaredoxin 3
MPPNLKIDIYTSRFDPNCMRAKGLLDRGGLDYNEFDVENDDFNREVMRKRSGGRTSLPQIFINGRAIGGFEELAGFLATLDSPPPSPPRSA